MFILRELNKRSEYNTHLGKTYHLIIFNTHNEEFKDTLRVYKSKFYNVEVKDLDKNITSKEQPIDDGMFNDIYAFIVDEKARQIPLWNKGMEYYIMTDSGKTFANVSY